MERRRRGVLAAVGAVLALTVGATPAGAATDSATGGGVVAQATPDPVVIVNGTLSPQFVTEPLAVRLRADGYTVQGFATVGGLVYALFDRVPKSGESLVHSGFRIIVERVHRRRIERVYFERLAPVTAPEDEE